MLCVKDSNSRDPSTQELPGVGYIFSGPQTAPLLFSSLLFSSLLCSSPLPLPSASYNDVGQGM